MAAALNGFRGYPHNDFHIVYLHGSRWFREAFNGNMLDFNILQGAGIDVVEMVMRVGIGIVKHFAGVDYYFLDQAFVSEQA